MTEKQRIAKNRLEALIKDFKKTSDKMSECLETLQELGDHIFALFDRVDKVNKEVCDSLSIENATNDINELSCIFEQFKSNESMRKNLSIIDSMIRRNKKNQLLISTLETKLFDEFEKNTEKYKILDGYTLKEEEYEVDGISFTMVRVSGGEFSITDNNKTKKIYLDDFYISKDLITKKLWKTLMSNRLQTKQESDKNTPAGFFSWERFNLFIRKLNRKTGCHFRLPDTEEWIMAKKQLKYFGITFNESSTPSPDRVKSANCFRLVLEANDWEGKS